MILKIYSELEPSETLTASPATVSMSVRELFPLLVHAHKFSNTWLKELGDDEVKVSEELADLLRGFVHLNDRRGA